MSKRIITIILVSLISLTCAFGSFASEIATSSNAQLNIAISSNAMPSDDFLESGDFDTLEAPALMSSGDDTVSNSVDYSGVQMCLAYYDMSGRIQHSFSQVNDNGYASIARPSDYASPYWFGFVLRKRALPPAGKYKVSVHFGSNTFISYDFTTFWFGVKYSNVSEQGSQIFVDGTYSSGDFSLSADVSIGASTSQFNISNFLKSDTGTPPWGGYVSINFTRLSGDAPVQGGSPDSGNVDQDINQSISNNTAQQVEQGDTIIELIKNTIQTISSQLTAFWNQLAGEFTNLYNKMTQQHSEQLQADRDNTDDIIAAEESNTTNIINNNNANTDKLSNGYDNSGMNSDNDRLNGSLTEYDQAEDNLMEDVNTGIGNIDFDFSFDSTLSVISTVSDFLQGIYERSGGFQVVINVCLILSLASCAVGLYRLKGGG
jgi:hypothetical protein|nr:MAG TPA: hypothetical protein [Inoviridae sp.]